MKSLEDFSTMDSPNCIAIFNSVKYKENRKDYHIVVYIIFSDIEMRIETLVYMGNDI